MAGLPRRILIKRMEDLYSEYLGQLHDGTLFWGYETWLYTRPISGLRSADLWNFRRSYAVLHLFDSEGRYQTTKYWGIDDTVEGSQRMVYDKLEEMIVELGEVEYRDIEVDLFQTIIDDVIFGLIANEAEDTITLQPSSLITFQEPWDGEYHT